ncbi:MAG: FTR1 family protein [Thermoplasmata archaeon]|nr:FTR1 family protein [Candidatus Sysuiplasma acidicola]MBX8645199.1 FTR1 family protein [Candidatus Sysuiplasma acidicola]MDH2905009.1 FTR1 family protein [Methanomassiliicoccales archaeon]
MAAFVISFREALEASLVVIVLSGYLAAVDPKRIPYVYAGVAAGIAVSVLLAAAFGYLYAAFGDYFEALMGIFAVAVLTYMILFMKKHSRSMRVSIERKLEKNIQSHGFPAIFFISFTTVLREGVEAVIFIAPFIFISETGSAIGAAGGIAAVSILFVALNSMTRKMDIGTVFRWTSLALIIFASAILSIVIHNLEQVGLIPAASILLRYRDTGYASSILHSMLTLLIGFDGTAYTLAQLVAYLILLVTLLVYFFKSGEAEHVPAAQKITHIDDR